MSKKRKPYYLGEVNIGGEIATVLLFKVDKKGNEKRPDFEMFVSFDEDREIKEEMNG